MKAFIVTALVFGSLVVGLVSGLRAMDAHYRQEATERRARALLSAVEYAAKMAEAEEGCER